MKSHIYGKIIACLLLLLALSASPSAQAQLAGGRIRITGSGADLSLRDTTLHLSFRAEIDGKAVKSRYVFSFQPVVTDGQYRVSFPPVVVRGKRAGMLESRRQWPADVGYEPSAVIYAAPGTVVSYNASVPVQPWMNGAEIVLESESAGCCTIQPFAEEPLLRGLDIPVFREPEPLIVAVMPEEPGPVTVGDTLARALNFVVPASEFDEKNPFRLYAEDRESSLVVYFRQNNFGIDSTYFDNRRTLTNLMAAVNLILQAPDSRIKAVVVAGFASPEGSSAVNDRLAWERAVSVKEYMMTNAGIAGDRILLYNGSTDWYGLRVLVEASDMPFRNAVLDILENVPVTDGNNRPSRLTELRKLAGGEPYRYMYDEFFPKLRNGAFIKVYYENR